MSLCDREEHQWRQWVDDTLVHLIAPNIYRSPVEAYSSLAYFRQALGENSMEHVPKEDDSRRFIQFLSSPVTQSLCRHHIEGNEREALHKALAHWSRAVGKSRSYMGGTSPNLSDLAVFGVLNSIEGCQAFKEVVAKNMELKSWYQRMQDLVENQAGLYSLPQTFHKKTPN
ncbi:PTGES2 [Cordylochernes scorpioides]|uniref:PTGES2 n=1 Tax=Cordylochernes scorpioides TaxID=51811 RepID=A0ABY6KN81_9ARAC|nr:PTGES2 [Cordylochernes scorpioides]